MSRILVLILIFVLFYQVSRMFINLFKTNDRGDQSRFKKKEYPRKQSESSDKGYKGGEYVDYEEVD